MMEALKIDKLRPGANGNNRDATNAANYDESKVNTFTLPDPLVCKDGTKVTTPELWWNKRRPEIVEDFDREVYGRVPRDVPKVTWEVAETKEEKVGDVAVVTKRLVGHVDNTSYPQIKVDIQLTLTTPADAKGPVPVMMEFGFGGFGPGSAAAVLRRRRPLRRPGTPRRRMTRRPRPRPVPDSAALPGAAGRRGSSSSSPRAGATRSSSRAAFRAIQAAWFDRTSLTRV